MAEEQEKSETPQILPESSGRQELPLDTQILSEAVIELNISRKNVGIYPPGHIQITRSIERAYDILQRLFEVRPEMTLGVAKDTLLVGQDYLDRKNSVYRDFALSLNQQGIAAVTFISGLEKDELVRFHRILTTKPEDIMATGGIEAVMAGAALQHIRIMAVNFSGIHVTEEEAISASAATPAGRPGADTWQDFVSLLSTGTLAGAGGVSLRDSERIDPAELARLLNERKLDPSAAIKSYDRVISAHLRGAAEKKELSQDQSKTLEGLNALLRDLGPELRKQFLSVAFERVSSAPSPAGTDDVVGGLADDMVIEMLSNASAEGREISPTLAGLVGRLAKARGESSNGTVAGGLSEAPILPEQMQKLFDREQYEAYVSRDYEALLKQVSDSPITPSEGFLIEDHVKTLEDGHLDFQIGRALLAFMEEDIDVDDYRDFAGKLVAVAPGFLESGNFELLFDIAETLRRHAAEKSIPDIRGIAEESRKMFADPEFITKALQAFERWMKEKGQEAAGLIRSLGPDTIPGLFDIFSRDESPGGKRILFNLLCLFGEPAIREAEKRLGDQRAYYVKNLLMLIRRAGTTSSIMRVKPLLKHRDAGVRMEALSTLLKFKDPGALKILRDEIGSEDPDISLKAVTLAGQYRLKETTEDILARIKRVILFDADYQWNEAIIKALGEIGDPRAVPDLEKLARAGWSLFPRSLMRMKELLFESLGRYPRESITKLIKIGEGTGNDKIVRACKKLAERQ